MNFSDFYRRLEHLPPDRILFVALGNLQRGNDGIAYYFLQALKRRPHFRRSHFLFVARTPENRLRELLDLKWQAIVFIDAADWGAPPGEICWLDINEIDRSGFSTHTYSIRFLLHMIHMQISCEIHLLGIQTRHSGIAFLPEEQLCRAVESFFAVKAQGVG